MTTPPAIVLLRIRKLAKNAIRRGQKLDPVEILRVISGEAKG